MISRVVVLLGAMLCAGTVLGQNATMLLKGGTIWTGDSAQPYVEAVAVRNGTILAVRAYHTDTGS